MKEPENCWEYIKCDKKIRENCKAYQEKEGILCAFVANHYCLDKARKDVKKCPNCAWFKKNNEKILDRLVNFKRSKLDK